MKDDGMRSNLDIGTKNEEHTWQILGQLNINIWSPGYVFVKTRDHEVVKKRFTCIKVCSLLFALQSPIISMIIAIQAILLMNEKRVANFTEEPIVVLVERNLIYCDSINESIFPLSILIKYQTYLTIFPTITVFV